MASTVYVAALEPDTGKSIIALSNPILVEPTVGEIAAEVGARLLVGDPGFTGTPPHSVSTSATWPSSTRPHPPRPTCRSGSRQLSAGARTRA